MRDLRDWGVDILTIGQYLQPSRHHLRIERYYTPEEFESMKAFGLELGFKWVESAPLVRSSYRAADQVQALSQRTRKEN
jgi:lipoic acid synthetase